MGDSLTGQYQARVAALLPGYAVTGAGVNGTGLLDSTVKTGKHARQLRTLIEPDVVVIEYTGNYRAGQKPPYASAKFYKQWAKSASKQSKLFRAWGARVIWVQVPQAGVASFASAIPSLNGIYRGQGETVDAWTAFGGATYNAELHISDRLHLSHAGVEMFAQLLAARVRG